LFPYQDTQGYKRGYCFFNVLKRIETNGGGIQHGWTVWESPRKFIQGEFHAVWVHPDGSYIDITPKEDGEERILFIPDPHRIYKGMPIENICLPLTKNPNVLCWIQECERRYARQIERDCFTPASF